MAEEPYYLALDPGHSTGWATFAHPTGDAITMGTCKGRLEVYELLRRIKPKCIIVEDWITDPNIPLGGDPLVTVRIIGAIDLYAYLANVPVHLQSRTIKGIGYMWAGVKKAKRKADSHELDAYVHGVYWLQKNNIRKPQQGIAQ